MQQKAQRASILDPQGFLQSGQQYFSNTKFYAIILTHLTKMCLSNTLCVSFGQYEMNPIKYFTFCRIWYIIYVIVIFLNAKLWFNLSNYCTDISRLNIVNNIVFSVFWKSESKVFGLQPNISFHHNLCYHLLVLHAAIDKFILKRQNMRRRKILETFLLYLFTKAAHEKTRDLEVERILGAFHVSTFTFQKS